MIKISYIDYRVIFFITSSLSTYVEAGLPLTKSLELIRESLNNLTYKNSLDRIISNLKNGQILSDAMAKEKKLYPALLIDMLKIGEESGRIDEVLVKISQH
ncbi:MAG: type II secretion system F family protein, partial [Sarcina sp.]